MPNLSKVSFQDKLVDIAFIYFGFILAFLGLSAFIRLPSIVLVDLLGFGDSITLSFGTCTSRPGGELNQGHSALQHDGNYF